MVTITTRFGEFRSTRRNIVGLSIYEASRLIRIGRCTIQPGDYFPSWHRSQHAMNHLPVFRLYGGAFVGRFRLDGSEITGGSYTIRWQTDGVTVTQIESSTVNDGQNP